MMMLNMDPPMHTRYRRLVNKGFTPRMIRDLEAKVVASADAIIDTVCERAPPTSWSRSPPSFPCRSSPT